MIFCGECLCGASWFRRLDEDETMYERYQCKQLLINFPEEVVNG